MKPGNDPQAERQQHYRIGLICIVSAFVVSRLIFWFAGIRFDIRPSQHFWQILDPALLQSDLFNSIVHLHCQPPLFNLFLGMGYTTCRQNPEILFLIVYLILGMLLGGFLFSLMHKMKAGLGISVALSMLFIISPACVLYENWLFYTYPVAVMLCGSALFLYRFILRNSFIDGFILFSLMSALILTRTTYQLVWFGFIFVLIVYFGRAPLKKTLMCSLLPLIAVLLWYLKNFLLFGTFASSTWGGVSLCQTTVFQIPDVLRNELIQNGILSRCSSLPPFSKPEEYFKIFPDLPESRIDCLDQTVRSTGSPNFNHLIYTKVSKKLLSDSLYVVWHYPEAHFRSELFSYGNYFLPSSDDPLLEPNRSKISGWDKFYRIFLAGQFKERTTRGIEPDASIIRYFERFSSTGLFLLLACPLLTLYASFVLWKKSKNEAENRPETATFAYMLFNVVYVTLISNAMVIMDQNRYRFQIDPFFMVFAAILLTRISAIRTHDRIGR